MISLSLMISYIKHHQYSAKSKYFGPFYYIQIDPQDYNEWCTTPPEEEIHFQTPSKIGSPTTPRSNISSEASESYITLTNFKKGIKRDCRTLGLTTFNSLLQYINWLLWEVCSVKCYRTRKLGYNNLNWPRCSARVTESLALTERGFCQKQTLYILDYVNFVSL